MRFWSVCGVAMLGLAACAGGTSGPAPLGPDGRPLPQVYRIAEADRDAIQIRFLDGVNALRQAAGAPPVQIDPLLTSAAATHSRDMSVQNRPWHFGSDGSSPLDRVRRAGFSGQLLGETISETYETELETLSAWMEDPAAREIILDPRARQIGFSWFQEPAGKIWWTMVAGTPQVFAPAVADTPLPTPPA